MLIRGKQLATGDDGIVTANLKDANVTAAKAKLDETWAFTAAPTYNADPASANQLARKSYVDGLVNGLTWKDSVVAATTASLTLATDVANGETIDAVVLATGDRILVKDQGDVENGIYIVTADAPTRAADLPAAAEAAGVAVFVEEGSANIDRGFLCTNNEGADVVGTDTLAFTQFTGVGADSNAVHVNASAEISIITLKNPPVSGDLLLIEDSVASNVKKRITVGTLPFTNVALGSATGAALSDTAANGSSSDAAKDDHVHPRDDAQQEAITTQVITGTDTAVTDTLSGTPINNASVKAWLNGIFQQQGATKDYTISGATITWLASSGTAVDMDTSDVLVVSFITQGA
jgi:hypothetical protein